jgi:hypothetical protein
MEKIISTDFSLLLALLLHFFIFSSIYRSLYITHIEHHLCETVDQWANKQQNRHTDASLLFNLTQTKHPYNAKCDRLPNGCSKITAMEHFIKASRRVTAGIDHVDSMLSASAAFESNPSALSDLDRRRILDFSGPDAIEG